MLFVNISWRSCSRALHTKRGSRMELSRHKSLLFALSFLGPTAFVVGCLIWAGAISPSRLDRHEVALYAVTLTSLGVVIFLNSEYHAARKVRHGPNSSEDGNPLDWCPPWLVGLSFLLSLTSMAIVAVFANVRCSHPPYTQQEAMNVCFMNASLQFFVLPFVVSANRVPGSFAANMEKTMSLDRTSAPKGFP